MRDNCHVCNFCFTYLFTNSSSPRPAASLFSENERGTINSYRQRLNVPSLVLSLSNRDFDSNNNKRAFGICCAGSQPPCHNAVGCPGRQLREGRRCVDSCRCASAHPIRSVQIVSPALLRSKSEQRQVPFKKLLLPWFTIILLRHIRCD